jgi:hypothetical protein
MKALNHHVGRVFNPERKDREAEAQKRPVTGVCRSGQRGQKQDYHCKFPSWDAHNYRLPWRSYMVRPRDLAVRVSDAQHRDSFRLPLDAARRKAREVIDQNPQDGLTPTVENWRHFPTVRLNLQYGTFPLRIDGRRETRLAC